MSSDNICSENETFESKKRKLLLEYEQNVRKKRNLNGESADVQLKMYPILADEYFRPIETVKMFVGEITLKKETSRLIKELSAIYPLGSHLKRVRWTSRKGIFEILLRPLRKEEMLNVSGCHSTLESVIKETNINSLGLAENVTIFEIPKDPPVTSHQYKECLKYWPIQFRENKYIEKVLSGELFDMEEKNNIVMFMKICLSAAQYGDEKVGCVIVDPILSKVIAVAHDLRHHHPVQHAVMVATDLVAKSHGGGSWSFDSRNLYHLPYSKEEADKKMTELKKLNPEKDVKKMCLPYLCTGYDAYISREPCVMCAMALVHSRIRRVFYARETAWGALGSHCKLHLQNGLNHHYEVWKITLEDEYVYNFKGDTQHSTNCDLKT